jgi:NAD(P)-dependent dehydrogenase (short-subunit alcohol dehydrogenase family)
VRCDHTVDADVAALFERVKSEAGRLDVLVNNAWGGYEGLPTGIPRVPFWEQPRVQWDGMFVAGVRATIVASQLAAPLMIASANARSASDEPSPSPSLQGRGIGSGGLIVNTVAWAYDEYLGSMFYDASKAAIVRLSGAMARDLKPHGVAVIALAPGFMRTERVMAAHAAHPFDLSWTESPEYLGRCVRALAEDADPMRHSGECVTVGDLAQEYGFTDVDGRQPAGFRMPKSKDSVD